jgi:O-antigen ligase
MLKIEVERRVALLLSFGALFITLMITDRISTDPVNVGKMMGVTVLAGAIMCLVLPYFYKNYFANRSALVLVLLFIFFSLLSLIFSSSPWERSFYGAFGRNTGLLTYLSLAVIFIGAISLRKIESYTRILQSFILAGLINVIYSIYALDGRDFIQWVNPFNKPIGTFGNPNFISSFMGIFVTVLLAFVLSSTNKRVHRVLFLILIIAALRVIDLSGSLQGFLVSIIGGTLVIFFFARSLIRRVWFSIFYLGTAASMVLIGALGILQIGFLAPFLYKPSVSIRGEYWQAGFNMWKSDPAFGIGMDSYGLLYRTFRDSSALKFPGINTVTDASHNVFIDILSGVGIFGFLAYAGILALVLKSVINYAKLNRDYDPIFVALFGGWATYQIQSIISINQIGLAIWGWLFGGLLVGYTSLKNSDSQSKEIGIFSRRSGKSKKNETNAQTLSAGLSLLSVAGAALGFFVALPPFLADAKMRNVMSGSVSTEQIASAATNWPQDNIRMYKAMIALANNGNTAEAQVLAAKAVLKFPNDYSVLWVLYNLTPDGTEEKASYRQKLHELDPYNPEFATK